MQDYKEKEEALYPRLQRYLTRHFDCFEAKSRVGAGFLGIVDVVGVRDVGGRFSGDIEVITVEVKLKANPFGKRIGQALGYSLCGHRCYLAVKFEGDGGFTQEQKELAINLGVGLIEIKKDITEVLTSPKRIPLSSHLLILLNNLRIGKCGICSMFLKIDNRTKKLDELLEKQAFIIDKTLRDEEKRKILFTKKRRNQKRAFVCRNCLERLRLIEG